MNFYHDGLDGGIRRIVAVIKTGRIKTISEVSQMGQEADGALWWTAEFLFDEMADGLVKAQFWVPKMISAAEEGHIRLLI